MTIFEQLRAYAPVNAQEASDRRLILQYAEQFGNLFTRKNEMAHLTASCWIVNPARTKALLAYHNIYDSWAWLGGHADGMEDLLAVACKEANEESGVTAVPVSPEIFSVEILGVAGHVKRGKYVSAHLHLNVTYLLQADESQALHEKPDGNSVTSPPQRGHLPRTSFSSCSGNTKPGPYSLLASSNRNSSLSKWFPALDVSFFSFTLFPLFFFPSGRLTHGSDSHALTLAAVMTQSFISEVFCVFQIMN